MALGKKELDFIQGEFGMSPADIQKLSPAEWKALREKSFMIEAEETPEDDSPLSDRGKTAAAIADTKYSAIS